GGFVQRVVSADPDERLELVRAFVREQVAGVLGYDEVNAKDDDRGMTALGLDSLMAVELSNRLGGAVGRTLSATLAFERPNITALAQYLFGLLKLDDAPGAGEVP